MIKEAYNLGQQAALEKVAKSSTGKELVHYGSEYINAKKKLLQEARDLLVTSKGKLDNLKRLNGI